MICEQCGNEIPDNSKFCVECGAKTDAVEPVMQAAEPEAAPAPPAAEPINQEKTPPPPPPAKPVPKPTPAPKTQYKSSDNLIKPLGVGSYIGIFILMAIPVVNLIMLLVWSFSDTVNLNKKHYAIAVLIMILISIIVSIGLLILAATVGGGLYRYYFWQ